VDEDLIKAADQDHRPAPRIEDLQGPAGRHPGELDPSVQRGATGAGLHSQDQGQQGESLIEAQSHRGGDGGELVLLDDGEFDGLFDWTLALTLLLKVPQSGHSRGARAIEATRHLFLIRR
jgi:hypothetical protein